MDEKPFIWGEYYWVNNSQLKNHSAGWSDNHDVKTTAPDMANENCEVRWKMFGDDKTGQ